MGQSDNLIIVLGLCLLGYWSYCLVWGFKGFRSSKTAQDYFIAGRDLSFWVFVLAVTATSFSGWTFMSHPGVIFQNGLQSAYASFYAIMIPFTGVLFLKRQWMLGKWKGYITPGDMFYDYFRISAIKPLVALVAVLFSVIYISIQLQASGYLFEVLVGWPMWKGMLVLSIVLGFYVILGGLRAVASVDTMQGVLLVFGMVVLGLFVLGKVGNLPQGIIELLEFDYIRITDNQYSHYAAVPTTLFEKEPPGGQWTAIFILTFMFAMMGIQASPAFTMWAFSSESPKPFGVQQVFASSLVVGGIMFTFTVIQGLGAHLLGADGDLNTYADLSAWKALFKEPIIQSDTLIPELISLMKQPLLTSLLAICALAAMQSTAASYITTTSAILTRDVFKRSTEQHRPVVWGRLFAIVIVTLSIVIAWNVRSNNLASLGGLAVAYGLQMVPALVAICWWPWLTGTGVAVGLVTGILAVTLTDALGGTFRGANIRSLSIPQVGAFYSTLPW